MSRSDRAAATARSARPQHRRATEAHLPARDLPCRRGARAAPACAWPDRRETRPRAGATIQRPDDSRCARACLGSASRSRAASEAGLDTLEDDEIIRALEDALVRGAERQTELARDLTLHLTADVEAQGLPDLVGIRHRDAYARIDDAFFEIGDAALDPGAKLRGLDHLGEQCLVRHDKQIFGHLRVIA